MRKWVRRVSLGVAVVVVVAGVLGATAQATLSRRDVARTPPPGELIDVGGHRLHLWCKGSGRPAVLMDAGLGHTSFIWNFVLDGVATFTHACAYDRAGQGYSEEASTPRTSLAIADEMHQLLLRAGIDGRVIVVGQSFGGINARLFASRFERQTGGLVLVDAPHEDLDGNVQLPFFAPLLPLACSFGVLRAVGMATGDAEREPASVREFVRATSFRTSRCRALYDEASHLRESASQVRSSRRQLSMPIAVLSRGRNQNPRSLEFQGMQAALSARGCQFTVDGAGHLIHRDRPDVVVKAIKATIEAAQLTEGTPCDLMASLAPSP